MRAHGSVFTPRQPGAPYSLESLLPSVRCTVLRAGRFRCPPDWHLPERVMPQHLLLACSSGQGHFRIADETYAVEAGGALFAPPRVPQAGWHDPVRPLEFCTVHLTARLYGVLDVPVIYGLPVAVPPGPRAAALLEAAECVVRELAGGEPGAALTANAYGGVILALLWREAVARAGGRPFAAALPAAVLARLAPAFWTIEARYDQRLTLRDLAGAVNLNPAYFSTLFSRATGLPPLRYLARFRLDRARELLLSTDLSVTEIGVAVGYDAAAYFSRVFARAEGCSPRAYRLTRRGLTVP